MDISVLKRTPLFDGMDEQDILPFLFSPDHALRKYRAGEFIAMQDEVCRSLLLLCSGNARSQMVSSEGKQLTVSTLSAPLLLAPAFVFSSVKHFPANIEAIDECEILAMNKESFLRFIREYPLAMNNFLQLVSDRVLMLSKKLKEFALQSLKSRLINYLRLHHSLISQTETAQILGVARPSLSRALSELIAEGCIRMENKEVWIDESKAAKYRL